MNPNFDNGAGADQEPDMQDPIEGGEGELNFSTADYPELEGLQPGAPVKVTCQATVSAAQDGQVSLAIDAGSCQFETEGQADKAMKSMSAQDSYQAPDNAAAGEDF